MGAPGIVDRTVALSCNGVETLIRAPSIIVRAIALRLDSVEAPLHIRERVPEERVVLAQVRCLGLQLARPA